MKKRLTRQVRHRLQLFLPVLGDPDRFLLSSLSLSGHALLVGVVQYPIQELWIQRVEYVEEILPRRPFAGRILIGEVTAQEIILGELRVEVLHREFLVVRYLDVINIGFLDQLLLISEHLLQKVFVDQGGRGQIELDYREVSNGG